MHQGPDRVDDDMLDQEDSQGRRLAPTGRAR